MPESVKLTNEIEKLSTLLDQLNSGLLPNSDDEEIAGLLAVASLIKQVGAPVPPPQHILQPTVDQIIDTMPSKRTNRFKTWLYSGILGTAASALLILGLNLMPSWTQTLPSAPPPTTPFVQNMPQENTSQQPPLVAQSLPQERIPPADAQSSSPTSDETEPSLPLATNPPLTIMTSAAEPSSKEQLAPPDLLISPPTVSEKSSPTTDFYTKRHLAYSSPPQKLKKTVYIPSALSLSGQIPDSITTDEENGTILQVFNNGTPEQIIITQRYLTTESTTAKVLPLTDKSMPGTICKVMINIYNQEVTITGRQSKSELLKIASSLTP